MNPVKNYLFELSDNEYVNNESPICIWGLSNLLNEGYTEIKEIYKGNLVKLISSELKVKSQNCRAFYHWLSGECPIPISKLIMFVDLWKNICDKTDKDVTKVIEEAYLTANYFSTKRGKKITLPKVLTTELAYLVGYIAGDGHLLDVFKEKQRTGDFEFRIEITSNDEYLFTNYVDPYFQKIFDIRGKFYKYKNRKAYEYYLSSKVLFIFLNKVFELPIGKKNGSLHVPKIILNSDSQAKASFLAGFFDTDGCVTVNKKIGFGLGDKSEELLGELKILFKDLNINTRNITRLGGRTLKGWEFSISRDSLLIFIDRIPSNHIRKSERLNRLKEILLVK
ncbi:MAG: LAGLIDADG family homing endonuclease [Nanoarchaeota archaeon]|nr:LAGLIDADG family homing endonuclease [Nanoarchaeota archaeon]